MRNRDSKGLMAFWTDIDEDYILEFQKWHNCQHVTERTSVPGFHVGRRYRGIGNAPMFFISYETAEAAVLNSDPYLNSLNNPTPWTKEALTHFNNNIRNIYTLLACEGTQAPTEAPYAHVIRFNMEPGAEVETVEWYAKELLPALEAIPGVFRVRLYVVDEEISNVMTAERAVYAGGPGQQKYLLYNELALVDLSFSKDWQEVQKAGDNPAMVKNLCDIYEELSWLEFVMYAPEGN
jgi:hypothetical protein